MRVRNASAAARLLLVVMLLAGGLIPGLQAPGEPVTAAPDATALKARANDGGKRGDRNHDRKKPDNGKKRNRGSKNTPRDLDADLIAAEKAKSVAGLECGGLIEIRVGDRVYCTHGDDPRAISGPASEGARVGAESVSAPVPPVLCLDDGESGPRVQLVYVRRNDRASRLPELLPTFRRLAAEMDLIFNQSAQKTGGTLRVRYLTDANCQVDVEELAVNPPSLQGFGSLIQKMQYAGYNDLDRKYLMLVDDRVFCGVGTYAGGQLADNRVTESHDFTGYARVDTPCWDAGSMAHELSHTLGAVQSSAPNTSRGGHCVDEWDVMCYSDEPYRPRMRILCDDGTQDFRLDCGNDDYFAANPRPGSYLARHWNTARSRYLTDGPEIPCVDAASEPDDAYWYWFWDVPMREVPVDTDEPRAFCQEPGDTDWVLFEADAGTSYAIETRDLAPGVDTQLVLYRGFEEQGWNGMDQFGLNDDRAEGDPSSRITFTAPSAASFLVGIANAGEGAGPDQTYNLSIETLAAAGTFFLDLSRTRGKPGAEFTLSARGLTPATTVKVWWQGRGRTTRLGDLTADDAGTATATYRVPKGSDPRVYQVEALASDGLAAAAAFKVLGDNEGKGKAQAKGKGKGKGQGKGKKDGRGRE